MINRERFHGSCDYGPAHPIVVWFDTEKNQKQNLSARLSKGGVVIICFAHSDDLCRD